MAYRYILAVIISGLLMLYAAQADLASQTRLESGLAEAVADTGLVGVGGIILQNGEVIALAVDGVRRKGKTNRIETDDLWHLGSVTKSMTGMLIGRLVDEGVVTYDQPLTELLPELAAEMDPGWQGVTLHHLMTHTAGMPANFPVTTQFIWPDTPEEIRAARRKALRAILVKAPKAEAGDAFLYSNAGITLAGHVAEEVTDTPYETLMAQKVFVPLGLETAGFGPPLGDNPWGHATRFFLTFAMDPTDKADNTPIMNPAGRAHMSLQDLGTFGQVVLDGHLGRGDYMSSEIWQKLHTPVLDEYAHGLGVMQREWAGGTLIWHNGTNTMWYALLLVFPEKDIVMAFTSNDGKFRDAEQAFFSLARAIVTEMSEETATESPQTGSMED
ncbi:MAG: beta-lactamase family protein [Aquisalinus sp.]|nr:beta-lactamase family protein [Aquisalinus sp.]